MAVLRLLSGESNPRADQSSDEIGIMSPKPGTEFRSEVLD